MARKQIALIVLLIIAAASWWLYSTYREKQLRQAAGVKFEEIRDRLARAGLEAMKARMESKEQLRAAIDQAYAQWLSAAHPETAPGIVGQGEEEIREKEKTRLEEIRAKTVAAWKEFSDLEGKIKERYRGVLPTWVKDDRNWRALDEKFQR